MDFQPLTEYLDSLAPDYQIPGNRCVVMQDHKVLYSHSTGLSDRENKKPASSDDIHLLWSSTKLSTCAAVLQLIEKGALRLEDPLQKYLPEFDHMTVLQDAETVPTDRDITIRDLLSMSAGFTYDKETPQIKRVLEKYGENATTRQVISAFAETPLIFQPGTHYFYSFCHDILAAVVEVVSGLKFSRYLQKYIFDPLDMHEIWFEVPEELRHRIVPHYSYDEATRQTFRTENYLHRISRQHESGGAGIFTTCDCYVKLVDALANDGKGATKAVILSKESVDLMKTNQLDDVRLSEFRAPRFTDYGYGLGVRTRMKSDGLIPVGEFGWDGAAGSFAMADTKNRLAIFFTMQVLNYYPPLYEQVHPHIRSLVYQCIQS